MENNNLRGKILYRSNTNRIIFGVCGGLGEYFNVDPIIFRILFLALLFGAGSGLLIYLILALLIPKNPLPAPEGHKTEPVDINERVNTLAQELKDLKNRGKKDTQAE